MFPHPHRHPHLRRAINLALAALTAAACPALPAAAAESKIDCGVAFDMAVSAYQGIRDSIRQDDTASAYRLKDVFWRIEKYSGGCEGVRKMGEMLAARKLGPQDTAASVDDGYGYAGSGGNTGSGSGGGPGSSGSSGSSGSAGSSSETRPEASTAVTPERIREAAAAAASRARALQRDSAIRR
jgi:hypothetical protein